MSAFGGKADMSAAAAHTSCVADTAATLDEWTPLPAAVDRRRTGSLLRRARDHDGQQLAYVYFEDEPGRRSAAKLLSKRVRRDVSRRTLLSWDWRNEMASAKHQLW